MSKQAGMMKTKLVYADSRGRIYDELELEMAGKSGDIFVVPENEELVPLPPGSKLFTMPGRYPVGWDREGGEFITLEGEEYQAVAAFPPPGYTRTLLPATAFYDDSQILPLWAYTAVGWKSGKFWIAAKQVEWNPNWEPKNFDDRTLLPKVQRRLKEEPDNRLLRHLSRCALDYHCFAAKNIFYKRWECPLPTSPACNARCLGCLSWQPKDSCEASHERIDFVPTAEEIVGVALPHLKTVDKAIVSFGQGCEGDPILQVGVLEEAIAKMRAETDKGTINMNTNASVPQNVERLCQAGLDSIRISLNSANESVYNRYFRPVNYAFAEVLQSMKIAKHHGLYVSINLFIFPGITDRPSEIDALLSLIDQTKLDLIQMRNLNIDPDVYLNALIPGDEEGIGIINFMKRIKEEFPNVSFGYFNRPKENF